MESPVVLDKPPEYHDRGFPFDEEESSGAWSSLAARHPDIAARLRQRPATWARKRRPSSQDATDDFGDSFGGFDRFPFDDIPPEFREHFPSHWNRRYGSREEQPQASSPPQQQTTATQTEARPAEDNPQTSLPQYGLRNTVDLGQRSPADPSLVDAEERTQRSMSAPPEARNQKMSRQNHQEPHAPNNEPSNVRHIPIFVEGRDEPVINKSVDHGTHFGESKPAYVPPPQPHIDRDQYFTDDSPTFHHTPNFSRAFGTPFNKGYRQGPQPFVQQKAYPQNAFTRGASPQRSQSPKPQAHPEEQYVKVPVHHEPPPKTEQTKAQQPKPQQQKPHPQQQQQPQQSPPQQPPQREQTPPQSKPQPTPNDPITIILSIQTDVLNLMTDVENFTGTKKDKKYLYLDEMLTRNLIKLDNIETDGKENIRQARKEAIKCIQKCIAVLEAKADSQNTSAQAETESQTQDVEMQENTENGSTQTEQAVQNGEVAMTKEEQKESQEPQSVIVNEAKEDVKPAVEPQSAPEPNPVEIPMSQSSEEKKEEPKEENNVAVVDSKDITPQAADTRPEERAPEQNSEAKELQLDENVDKKSSPKKGAKVVKKRDKSKDKNKDSIKADDKEKELKVEKTETTEVMQIDDKGDKTEAQMEVDGAASQ